MAKVKITVDEKKCNRCEECVISCPSEVLQSLDSKVVPVNTSECILCRACEGICPNDAVKVEEEA